MTDGVKTFSWFFLAVILTWAGVLLWSILHFCSAIGLFSYRVLCTHQHYECSFQRHGCPAKWQVINIRLKHPCFNSFWHQSIWFQIPFLMMQGWLNDSSSRETEWTSQLLAWSPGQMYKPLWDGTQQQHGGKLEIKSQVESQEYLILIDTGNGTMKLLLAAALQAR